MSLKKWLKYAFQSLFYLIVFLYALGPAVVPLHDTKERIRAFTRAEEFDYVDWTVGAIDIKLGRVPLKTASYLDREGQRQVVLDYLDLIQSIQAAEAELNLIYAAPNIEDPKDQAAPISQQLDVLNQQRGDLAPLTESVLQEMVAVIVTKLGFSPGGQPIPPVLYHSTPLPWALIVSPRDRIEQTANISLETSLTVEDHIQIEDQISKVLGYSTLVVPVGGIGTYPTMVAQTTNLNWLAEVVSHEWTHNYLTLRPLGLRYEQSPELRTINETTANLAGKEIGAALIAEFFPEFIPPPPTPIEEDQAPAPTPEPPAFDFRSEMYQTRMKVDQMLADGEVEEAERYMEVRRQFFWDHGYHIRKLNQAYFAFYGAYADQPVGSAGEDPVGAAVRELRAQSNSLIEFIHTVSKVTSFEQLQDLVE